MGRRWFNTMGRTMTGGTSQSTLKQYMLAHEEKPINSESISFGFQSYAKMLAIELSPWFTLIGWAFLILRLALGS
jgi:hypothetical protein